MLGGSFGDLSRAMTHKNCSLALVHLFLLFAVALTLTIPALAEWKEKVLYSFQGGADAGSVPAGGVVFDKQGNLYVATTDGGPPSCAPIGGACGTVYQLSPPAKKGDPWTATLIRMFEGKKSNDASVPTGGLILDGAGNLYGVTGYGGTGDCVLVGVPAGCGTVYELSPPAQKGGAWTETILYSFPNSKQGYLPNGSLVFDSEGNLYGATMFGGGQGTTCDAFYQYCGAVFKLSPPKTKGGKWTEKVLHAFKGGTDGANPNGGLTLDSKGAIYGTTFIGGFNCPHNSGKGCGTVFRLRPPSKKGGTWAEKQLHVFAAKSDGANPAGGLIFDAQGSLYGTAEGGNISGGGVVFRLTAAISGQWDETVLHWFSNDGPGASLAGLLFDSAGNLYGTTIEGSNFCGTVFRLKPPAEPGDEWSLNVLYTFNGAPDGRDPAASVIFDAEGNVYSTTEGGGSSGYGTVFEIRP
jgi:uncharacterized repeat protein (TIGR03803 family)